MQAQKLQAAMVLKLQQQYDCGQDTRLSSSIEKSIQDLLAYVESSWGVQLSEMPSVLA